MSTTLNPLGEVNSTSYQDVAGLYAGIQRFPGETTTAFKNRLEINSNNIKRPNYEGIVENVNNRLGLSLFEVMSITTTYTDAFVECSFGEIIFSSTEENITIPTLSIAPDGMWIWDDLSTVVATINNSVGFRATLLCVDGSAIQIAKQSNSNWVLNEPVNSRVYPLNFTGYITNTATFNQSVNSFTITNGILTTDQEYPNLTISYQYKIWPYSVVGSQAIVISLVDPDLQSFIIAPSGDLVYQIQEVIQSLMQLDSSYWGE